MSTTLISVVAALAGVLAGAVLKHFFDLRASRRTKLLDEKLKYAVAFLAAADWAARSYADAELADDQLDHAITQGSDRERADAERRHENHKQQGDASLKDAHMAACALRLLVPELGAAPGDYLALAVGTGPASSPDEQRKLEAARASLEMRLMGVLGTTSRRAVAAG